MSVKHQDILVSGNSHEITEIYRILRKYPSVLFVDYSSDYRR